MSILLILALIIFAPWVFRVLIELSALIILLVLTGIVICAIVLLAASVL